MVDRKFLLQQAKNRYPIGTVIICVGNKVHCKVTREPYFYFEGENCLAGANSQCVLYLDGKWAEIVSLPYEKQIELW